jgi:hypothetical protein
MADVDKPVITAWLLESAKNDFRVARHRAEDRAKIEAVDPAIELTDAGGWYDGEIRETWPAFTTARTTPTASIIRDLRPAKWDFNINLRCKKS